MQPENAESPRLVTSAGIMILVRLLQPANALFPMLITLLAYKMWITAGLFYLLPCVLFAPWYGSFVGALLTPYAIYFFQLIALNAMISTTFGRRTLWKGRAV